MHEIVIMAQDENGEFKKKVREGVEEECDITLKLLPPFVKELYNCWCENCDEERVDGCKKTLYITFDGLEYMFIDHYFDLG